MVLEVHDHNSARWGRKGSLSLLSSYVLKVLQS